MNVFVERQPSSSLSTISKVYVDGVYKWTALEPPVREVPGVPVEEWKIPGVTAIPAGKYRLILSPSDRFSHEQPYCMLADGRVPEVMGVPDFLGVRIHVGNFPKDTEGCLLIGKQQLQPDSIALSRIAYGELIAVLLDAEKRGDPVWITYTTAPKD